MSAAAGVSNPTRQQRLRLGGVFALFEGGMPAIGVLVGGPFSQVLGATADYVAIAILLGFGAFTLVHGDDDEEGGVAARHRSWASPHPERAECEPR